ncbi:MAG: CynX/NimT family MFS transporter [Nitrospinota bacterium]
MATQNRWFLLAVAWCVALNLRGISLAVSPILPLIKADLGLSYAEAGFLFGVPTVSMAVFGLPGGRLADTFGMKRTLTLGLSVILAGSALRAPAGGFLSLVVWMAVLGAGMGISGPGLTRMVKDRFPDLPGTATGIYTSGLVTGATLGAWLTVPYLLRWAGSWRGTFLLWSAVTLVTLAAWWLLVPAGAAPGGRAPRLSGIWRDRTVWKLNVIFLSQSLLFYSLSAWMPTYYHELGLTLEEGTRLLSVLFITNLPSSLAVPYFSDRFGGRRASILVSGVVLLPAMLGMIFFPLAAPWTLAVVIGLCMGGVFALTFALPLDYVEPGKVGSVAGANLLVGYGGTFLGPLLMGLVHDLTASFRAGWLVVVVILLVLLATAASLPKRTV